MSKFKYTVMQQCLMTALESASAVSDDMYTVDIDDNGSNRKISIAPQLGTDVASVSSVDDSVHFAYFIFGAPGILTAIHESTFGVNYTAIEDFEVTDETRVFLETYHTEKFENLGHLPTQDEIDLLLGEVDEEHLKVEFPFQANVDWAKIAAAFELTDDTDADHFECANIKEVAELAATIRSDPSEFFIESDVEQDAY